MTNSDSPAASSLATRYGTPKRTMSKKVKIVLTSVVIILATTWVLWTVLGGGASATPKVFSYSVIDPTLATVELSVTKDPSATAQCWVQALGSTFAVVGSKTITIEANDPDGTDAKSLTTRVHADVRTDSLAVTVVVDNCWIMQ